MKKHQSRDRSGGTVKRVHLKGDPSIAALWAVLTQPFRDKDTPSQEVSEEPVGEFRQRWRGPQLLEWTNNCDTLSHRNSPNIKDS